MPLRSNAESPYAASLSSPYAAAPASRHSSPYGSHGSHGSGSHHHGDGGKRRRIAPVVITIVVVAVLAALAAGGLSLKATASRVMEQARTLSATVTQVEEAAKNLDGTALQQAATTLTSGIDAIEAELDAPLIRVASVIPLVSEPLDDARQLLSAVDTLASDVLAPAGQTLASYPLTSLASGSGVNGAAVSAYSQLVAQIAPVVDSASQKISAIGTSSISQLNDVVSKLKEPLSQASELLDTYEPLLAQLPELLGCNGTRTYLIVAQNNSELRATGGFPGAWGTVTVSNGTISMGEFTTIAGKRDVTFNLTDEEISVFGAEIANNPASLNVTPDFPRAASLLATAWAAYTGQSVDGVIAMDPRFLQDVLALTGGVTASDGTVVDGTNAAWVLLSDVYWRYGYDGTIQDAFFAEVAGLAADEAMGNLASVDFQQLLDTVKADAAKGRLLVWSSNSDVEAALASVDGLTGALGSDPANPVLGVYVNDNTWAKICWYLTLNTQVTGSVTNADGTVTYDVTTTFTNTITAEEAESAYTYITGDSPLKRSTDDMCLSPLLVAPAGGTITDVACSGVGTFTEVTLYGHDVWAGSVNIGAQETATVTYKVTVAAGASALLVHQTPTAQGE